MNLIAFDTEVTSDAFIPFPYFSRAWNAAHASQPWISNDEGCAPIEEAQRPEAISTHLYCLDAPQYIPAGGADHLGPVDIQRDGWKAPIF